MSSYNASALPLNKAGLSNIRVCISFLRYVLRLEINTSTFTSLKARRGDTRIVNLIS